MCFLSPFCIERCKQVAQLLVHELWICISVDILLDKLFLVDTYPVFHSHFNLSNQEQAFVDDPSNFESVVAELIFRLSLAVFHPWRLSHELS